jgi:serine/threonine protein kinase
MQRRRQQAGGGRWKRIWAHFHIELQECSLRTVLKKYKPAFSKECIILVCLDILQGLSFSNWVKICHRDLSPGNILISEDGTLKISDVGEGKVIDGKNEQSNSITGTKSIRAVKFIGELISCDIWLFGIILSFSSTCPFPKRLL